ncbi:MAG TPA: hypothetical protein VGJ71_09235 [Candidatus Limnocylindrales bacterium]
MALAHGELILQLGAEQVQPGGSIEVRGDLGTGESFEVALISKADGSRRLIATIPAVEEGHFQTFVTIPADLAPGAYLLEVAVDLIVARAPLSVAGSPITGEGGGDGPDHADPLVQPMPGSSPAVGGANGAGLTGSAAPGTPASTRAGRSALDGLVIVAVAVLGAAALAVVLRLAGRRGAQGKSEDPKRG